MIILRHPSSDGYSLLVIVLIPYSNKMYNQQYSANTFCDAPCTFYKMHIFVNT